MKILAICALLPLAMCLPAFLDEDQLKADVLFLGKKFASSDLLKKACEAECERHLTTDKEVNKAFGCPLACSIIQEELQMLVQKGEQSKRTVHSGAHSIHLPHLNLTSLFDIEAIKQDLQLIVDLVGSDAAEQKCEQGCQHVLHSGRLLKFGCPILCHSFQTLVHTFNIKPDPTSPHHTG